MIARGLRLFGATLLWLTIAACLAIAVVPRFLDRIYYRGPASAHFDGERFFNPDGADDVLAARGGMARRLLTGDDRPPWPAHYAARRAKPPARVPGDAMLATWVGHATVLVQTQGLNILTDPVWSDTVGPWGIGPRRIAAPGIAFDDLPPIDLVLVSHNHYDHMDLATLKRLWQRDRPLILTSLGNDAILRGAGIAATALDWGGSVRFSECPKGAECEPPPGEAIVTRNHHWGSRWFSDRNRALWSSFVVRLPGGNIVFAGDTGAGDMTWVDEAARLGPVRLAILPIGAFRFQAGQMDSGSHIGPVDAVGIYRRLGATSGIAVHWGTFRLSYEGWDTPPRMLRAAMACTYEHGFRAVPLGTPLGVPVFADRAFVPEVPRAALLKCLDTAQVRALR